jgi:serine/threonine protein kinase
MIAPLIGFALPGESSGRLDFKTARLHAAEGSLAAVLSAPPAWWTPTAKAKAVAGIALGLRFAHGLGLLHCGLKASNVLVDAARRIQIADFSPTRLDTGQLSLFRGKGGRQVRTFPRLLSFFLRSLSVQLAVRASLPKSQCLFGG